MDMKRLIVLAFVGILLTGAAYAVAPVRVDYNGEMVTMNSTPGSVSGDVPEGWSSYGIGTIENGGSHYNTGSSSNAYGVRYENEDNVIPGVTWTYPGTHSYRFGGAISGQIGQAGLQQTYTGATAGKVYFYIGGVKYVGNSNIRFDFGIENGYNRNVGMTTSNRTGSGSNSFNGKRQFTQSVVATGSALTFHAGMNVVNSTTNDPASNIDGLRVWEFDTTANSSLVNGGFDGATTNLTNYAAKGADSNIRDWMCPEGWIPLTTGAVGQNEGFYTGVGSGANAAHGGNALFIDQYNGEGKKLFAQRVSMGAGIYTLNGYVKGWDTVAGAPKIGIDPTGGLDPNSANVIWSSTVTGNVWELKTVSNVVSTGGTVTIFVGGGLGTYSSSGGGVMFDDIALTFIPEPGSLLALATGLFGLIGVTRRRR